MTSVSHDGCANDLEIIFVLSVLPTISIAFVVYSNLAEVRYGKELYLHLVDRAENLPGLHFICWEASGGWQIPRNEGAKFAVTYNYIRDITREKKVKLRKKSL